MEHNCYRCGQPVEEGAAFCENCHAPQIKVAVATESQPATAPMKPGTPDDVQPPARPVGLNQAGQWSDPAAAPQPFRWHDAMPGAMLAGAAIGVVLLVPLAAYLLCPIVAGALAVLFYTRKQPGIQISPGAGARIGAIAGLFAFLLFSLLTGAEIAATSGNGKFRDTMMQAIQQSAARNPSPEAQQLAQKMMTPEGVALMVVLVFIIFLIMFVALSSVGGVLGAKLTRKK